MEDIDNVTIAKSGDYTAIYLNGNLELYGLEIDPRDLLGLLNIDYDIVFKSSSSLDEEEDFPDDLSDLELEDDFSSDDEDDFN